MQKRRPINISHRGITDRVSANYTEVHYGEMKDGALRLHSGEIVPYDWTPSVERGPKRYGGDFLGRSGTITSPLPLVHLLRFEAVHVDLRSTCFHQTCNHFGNRPGSGSPAPVEVTEKHSLESSSTGKLGKLGNQVLGLGIGQVTVTRQEASP